MANNRAPSGSGAGFSLDIVTRISAERAGSGGGVGMSLVPMFLLGVTLFVMLFFRSFFLGILAFVVANMILFALGIGRDPQNDG